VVEEAVENHIGDVEPELAHLSAGHVKRLQGITRSIADYTQEGHNIRALVQRQLIC
jgi:hypothetical protein